MRAWFIGLMTIVPIGILGASCALGTFEKVEAPSDAGPDGCVRATVPLPPLPESLGQQWPKPPKASGEEFTTAIRVLRTKFDANGGPLGLDLDRFCSCQDEPVSCVPRADQDKDLSCDLPGGRDNQLTQFFRLIELVLSLDPETDSLGTLYSSFAELGRWTIVFRVTGYNGLPNDDKVRVEWYPSNTLYVDGGLPDGQAPMPPVWNGQDTWAISPSAVLDASAPTETPVFFDNDAYVTNGTLVFALQEGDLVVTNGLTRLSITISNGVVMAEIDPYSDSYFLRNGLMAGRVSEQNLFKMVSQFRDHNGAPFCTVGNPYWLATRDAICRGGDIQVGPPSPNKRCDAISMALGFQADPALLGGVGATLSGQMDCPNGQDPLTEYLEAGCPPPLTPIIDAGAPPDASSD